MVVFEGGLILCFCLLSFWPDREDDILRICPTSRVGWDRLDCVRLGSFGFHLFYLILILESLYNFLLNCLLGKKIVFPYYLKTIQKFLCAANVLFRLAPS